MRALELVLLYIYYERTCAMRVQNKLKKYPLIINIVYGYILYYYNINVSIA